MIKPYAVAGAAALFALAAACSRQEDVASPAAASAGPRTDPQRLSRIVQTLASDAFEGRAAGTPGEARTAEYLIGQFKALGLEPGGPHGQYVQQVPLVNTQLGAGRLSITQGDGAQALPLVQGETINVTTVRPDPHIAIHDAPLVFVGYGVDAPDQNWDDYKGVDLHGKVAVFLVNDPDFEAQPGDDAEGRFGGRRMSYFGRWTYKFAEAARRGAVAALIVHDTEGAGYGWQTVIANQGGNSDIVRAPGDEGVPLQGWLAHEASDRLFSAAGLDLPQLRVQARSAAFRPVALKGLSFSADLPVSVTAVQSQNFLARLPGKTHAEETLLFGAHWDAYGVGAPDAQGRSIRAGANDDALGLAGVLELARLFKAAAQTDRTLIFAAWTAEERGLLGSEYYAAHPVYPLAKTVAVLNLDILQTAGPARNVVEVGMGNSSLDGLLQEAAAAQGRVVEPETFVERGLFYRADHFPMARRGVPALLLMALGGAPDLVFGGKQAGQQWLDGYMKCYHQACDTWSADWDLRGAAQDVDLYYAMATALANGRDWPRWNEGVAFKAVREQTADQRR